MTANAPDGRFLQPGEIERDLEATWVRQCLEAGPDGSLVRSRVRFDRWTSTGGAATDESLVGAVLETGPDGFRVVSASCNPSEQARAWLRSTFVPNSPQQRTGVESFRPTGPVAVGETWECDAAALATFCADATSLPVAPVVARLTLRLDEVTTTDAGDTAKVRVEGRVVLPVGKAKEGPALEILEDSAYEFSGEFESVPGRDHRHGRTRLAADVDVRAKVGSLELFLAGSVERKRTSTAGGDAPKTPARAADAPPPVQVAAPAAWKAGAGFVEKATEVVADVSTPVDGDGKEGVPERTGQAVDWTAEHRCTEVGEDGAPRAMTVTFTKFRSVEGTSEDESLEGAVVEWRDGKWKIAKEGAKPSKAARKWLDSRFERGAAGDDLLLSTVTPVMPVTPGATWKGDSADATLALRSRFPYPIDAGKTLAEGTLARASGPGRPCDVSYRVSARISCVAGCDCPNAEVMRGGTIEVRGTATGAPCDWTRGGTWQDETKIAVAVPDGGSNFRRVSTTRTRHVERSPLVPAQQ